MWYIIIIFIISFEIVLSLITPSFYNFSTTGGVTITTDVSANTTSELIATGLNPLSAFADIMTFQLQGLEGLSIIFVFLDILFVICIIRLIRGSD